MQIGECDLDGRIGRIFEIKDILGDDEATADHTNQQSNDGGKLILHAFHGVIHFHGQTLLSGSRPETARGIHVMHERKAG